MLTLHLRNKLELFCILDDDFRSLQIIRYMHHILENRNINKQKVCACLKQFDNDKPTSTPNLRFFYSKEKRSL